jgi:hypothetical protein
MGKVSHISAIEARKVAGWDLLRWPNCSLLQWSSGSTVELLLLRLKLPLLVLQAIATILLWRITQLSCR